MTALAQHASIAWSWQHCGTQVYVQTLLVLHKLLEMPFARQPDMQRSGILCIVATQ